MEFCAQELWIFLIYNVRGSLLSCLLLCPTAHAHTPSLPSQPLLLPWLAAMAADPRVLGRLARLSSWSGSCHQGPPNRQEPQFPVFPDWGWPRAAALPQARASLVSPRLAWTAWAPSAHAPPLPLTPPIQQPYSVAATGAKPSRLCCFRGLQGGVSAFQEHVS